MRIIRHGNQYEIDQIVCPICECEFIYNKDDIEEVETDLIDTDGNQRNFYSIVRCPECGFEINVSDFEIYDMGEQG